MNAFSVIKSHNKKQLSNDFTEDYACVVCKLVNKDYTHCKALKSNKAEEYNFLVCLMESYCFVSTTRKV